MLPRHILPQIPGDKLQEYVSFLHENDVDSKLCISPIGKLKPIQKAVNTEKVEQLEKHYKEIVEKPIIVDQSGLILDGHHRWIALRNMEMPKVIILLCKCPMIELIKLSHMFDYSTVKSMEEINHFSEDTAEHGYDIGRDDFIESKNGDELIVRKVLGLDDDINDFYEYGKYYNFGQFDNNYSKYNEEEED